LTNESDEILKKEYARAYFLLTGNNLSDVDPASYGFSLQELLDHKKLTTPFRISLLNPGIFRGLCNLEVLELSDNQLTAFDWDVLRKRTNLRALILKGICLRCFLKKF